MTALLVLLVAAVAGVSFVAKARRGQGARPVAAESTPGNGEHPTGS